MNILITGASGFLGTAFLNYIKKNNIYLEDRIILLTSKQIEGYECVLHKNYTFTKEDFISQGIVKIDLLFHLGAAVPRKSDEFGTEFVYKFSRNIICTAWLMNNLPSNPSKIVYISTVSVYEKEDVISESTHIQTGDMYGASKLMCEAYLLHIAQEKHIIIQILRLGQIYGEGEEVYSKILSFFVKQVFEENIITIYGTGDEKRSMLYVEDCIKYILAASKMNCYKGPINIASGDPISVLDIISLVKKGCNKEPKIVKDVSKKSQSIVYNTEKKNRLFNIKETNYETGILNYCKYYVERYGK